MGAQIGGDGKYENPFGLVNDWAWTNFHTLKSNKGKRFGIIFLGSSLAVSLMFIGAFHILGAGSLIQIILIPFAIFVIIMALLRVIAVFTTTNLKRHPVPPELENNTILPSFTILVPLYHEANMVTQLMDNLEQLDYPHDRLNIILVCEADDKQTCQAVRAALRPPFTQFEVAPSMPRTKPKALNEALHALPLPLRGDIVSVYDAEDKPHPNQLRQAALAFLTDSDVVAVQAPLGYYNDDDNILTALFGLEYAALFHVWNPALANFGLPFTLGGTSNHIRRDILERVGGWDAHNVTEDADLGFRIFALNTPTQKFKIQTIPGSTEEEAIGSYREWAAQRSRWLKGFMQTWCVHMRQQKLSAGGTVIPKRTRLRSFISLQITLGATLFAAFLHLPSIVIMATLFATDYSEVYKISWPIAFFMVMLTGYSASILTAIIGAVRARKYHLIKFVLFMPFYWLLYFWPALIAAYEIIYAPDYWHKTSHKIQATSKSKIFRKQRPSTVDNKAYPPI